MVRCGRLLPATNNNKTFPACQGPGASRHSLKVVIRGRAPPASVLRRYHHHLRLAAAPCRRQPALLLRVGNLLAALRALRARGAAPFGVATAPFGVATASLRRALQRSGGVRAPGRAAGGRWAARTPLQDTAPPPPPPLPPRTKWTRRVPHPVLIGHAASLTVRQWVPSSAKWCRASLPPGQLPLAPSAPSSSRSRFTPPASATPPIVRPRPSLIVD